MAMFDSWHRRWLRRQLERSGVVDGDDVAFSQVETDDGWSGWVTADAVPAATPPVGFSGRCTAGTCAGS